MSEEVAAATGQRRWLWVVVAAVAALLAVGLWLSSRPSTPRLQGEVEAREVNVASRIAGTAGQPTVKEGDRVAAGQLLLTLTAPAVDALQQQTNATLETARAIEQAANSGVRPEDIASLSAISKSADAQARLAAVSARRADNLYAEGVIAAQRRDEARALAASTAAQATAARLQYQKAAAGARDETRRAAAAQVEFAGGGTKLSAAMQADREIRAPVAGEIAKALIEPGEVVAPAIPLFQIVDVDRPWVRLSVGESDMTALRQGSTINGSIPALGLDGVPFMVKSIAAQGEYATRKATRQSSGFDERSFELKLEPARPVKGLRPGMSVLFDRIR
ncbi:HlyD family secretion protein [Sphingomonas jaspsi]|uniref:HlyD family secretion protein n=1 Tax=Sphingomonas jaspsi TaxID=392409 RepID=UPI0004AFC60F|nr:HlyD family secretion protein [Sphingomonas jaspsi]